MIGLILYLIAAICLALAAFGVTARSISLGWLGVFFFVLVSALHGGRRELRGLGGSIPPRRPHPPVRSSIPVRANDPALQRAPGVPPLWKQPRYGGEV